MVTNEVISVIPTNFGDLGSSLWLGLKIFIGVVGVYFIFWIINMFINHRKNKTLNEILVNLKEINKKLDNNLDKKTETEKTKNK